MTKTGKGKETLPSPRPENRLSKVSPDGYCHGHYSTVSYGSQSVWRTICKSEEEPVCPICQNKLKFRDWRRRISLKEGREVTWIMIRRLYCRKCRRLHNELPDILSPYKHYDAETIEGVVDGIVLPDDRGSETYPCEATMNRWKQWITHNTSFIEGFLRLIGYSIMELGKEYLMTGEKIFDSLRKRLPPERKSWLGYINRIIYNSGASLEPFPRVEAP